MREITEMPILLIFIILVCSLLQVDSYLELRQMQEIEPKEKVTVDDHRVFTDKCKQHITTQVNNSAHLQKDFRSKVTRSPSMVSETTTESSDAVESTNNHLNVRYPTFIDFSFLHATLHDFLHQVCFSCVPEFAE